MHSFSDEKQELFELLLREGGIDLPPLPAMPKRDVSKPCRLAIAQEMLWNSSKSDPTCELYNEVILLRFSGSLNVAALTQSLNEMVRRHEILRTRFAQADGQVYQLTSAELKLEMPIADLGWAPARQQKAIWKRLLDEGVSRAFKLEELPLLRCALIVLGRQEQLVLMTLHKIICDKWSRKIIVNELSHLYESFVVGEQPALDELEIQYGDFAMWQREQLEAGEFDRDIRYWNEKLRNELTPVTIAGDISRPLPSHRRLASCDVRLSNATGRQMKQVTRNQGLTSYMILLAGWYALLRKQSGQEEIFVFTLVANRGRSEFQNLIGPLSNTVMMKLNLKGNPGFKEVMRAVRETVIEALEHQEMGCELAMKGMARLKAASRNPLAVVMFMMEEAITTEAGFGGLNVIEEDMRGSVAQSDLAIVMRQVGETFEGRIEYNTALFDDKTIRCMAASYQELLVLQL